MKLFHLNKKITTTLLVAGLMISGSAVAEETYKESDSSSLMNERTEASELDTMGLEDSRIDNQRLDARNPDSPDSIRARMENKRLGDADSEDMDREDQIEEINELIEGEISAVQTYIIALRDFGDTSSAQLLKSLKADHEEAVKDLSSRVTALGGQPSTEAGAWGYWARAVERSATAFGEEAALQALLQGEEHGLDEYEDLAEEDEDEVAADFREKINNHYIPKQKEHISKLERQIEQIDS